MKKKQAVFSHPNQQTRTKMSKGNSNEHSTPQKHSKRHKNEQKTQKLSPEIHTQKQPPSIAQLTLRALILLIAALTTQTTPQPHPHTSPLAQPPSNSSSKSSSQNRPKPAPIPSSYTPNPSSLIGFALRYLKKTLYTKQQKTFQEYLLIQADTAMDTPSIHFQSLNAFSLVNTKQGFSLTSTMQQDPNAVVKVRDKVKSRKDCKGRVDVALVTSSVAQKSYRRLKICDGTKLGTIRMFRDPSDPLKSIQVDSGTSLEVNLWNPDPDLDESLMYLDSDMTCSESILVAQNQEKVNGTDGGSSTQSVFHVFVPCLVDRSRKTDQLDSKSFMILTYFRMNVSALEDFRAGRGQPKVVNLVYNVSNEWLRVSDVSQIQAKFLHLNPMNFSIKSTNITVQRYVAVTMALPSAPKLKNTSPLGFFGLIPVSASDGPIPQKPGAINPIYPVSGIKGVSPSFVMNEIQSYLYNPSKKSNSSNSTNRQDVTPGDVLKYDNTLIISGWDTGTLNLEFYLLKPLKSSKTGELAAAGFELVHSDSKWKLPLPSVSMANKQSGNSLGMLVRVVPEMKTSLFDNSFNSGMIMLASTTSMVLWFFDDERLTPVSNIPYFTYVNPCGVVTGQYLKIDKIHQFLIFSQTIDTGVTQPMLAFNTETLEMNCLPFVASNFLTSCVDIPGAETPSKASESSDLASAGPIGGLGARIKYLNVNEFSALNDFLGRDPRGVIGSFKQMSEPVAVFMTGEVNYMQLEGNKLSTNTSGSTTYLKVSSIHPDQGGSVLPTYPVLARSTLDPQANPYLKLSISQFFVFNDQVSNFQIGPLNSYGFGADYSIGAFNASSGVPEGFVRIVYAEVFQAGLMATKIGLKDSNTPKGDPLTAQPRTDLKNHPKSQKIPKMEKSNFFDLNHLKATQTPSTTPTDDIQFTQLWPISIDTMIGVRNGKAVGQSIYNIFYVIHCNSIKTATNTSNSTCRILNPTTPAKLQNGEFIRAALKIENKVIIIVESQLPSQTPNQPQPSYIQGFEMDGTRIPSMRLNLTYNVTAGASSVPLIPQKYKIVQTDDHTQAQILTTLCKPSPDLLCKVLSLKLSLDSQLSQVFSVAQNWLYVSTEGMPLSIQFTNDPMHKYPGILPNPEDLPSYSNDFLSSILTPWIRKIDLKMAIIHLQTPAYVAGATEADRETPAAREKRAFLGGAFKVSFQGYRIINERSRLLTANCINSRRWRALISCSGQGETLFFSVLDRSIYTTPNDVSKAGTKYKYRFQEMKKIVMSQCLEDKGVFQLLAVNQDGSLNLYSIRLGRSNDVRTRLHSMLRIDDDATEIRAFRSFSVPSSPFIYTTFDRAYRVPNGASSGKSGASGTVSNLTIARIDINGPELALDTTGFNLTDKPYKSVKIDIKMTSMNKQYSNSSSLFLTIQRYIKNPIMKATKTTQEFPKYLQKGQTIVLDNYIAVEGPLVDLQLTNYSSQSIQFSGRKVSKHNYTTTSESVNEFRQVITRGDYMAAMDASSSNSEIHLFYKPESITSSPDDYAKNKAFNDIIKAKPGERFLRMRGESNEDGTLFLAVLKIDQKSRYFISVFRAYRGVNLTQTRQGGQDIAVDDQSTAFKVIPFDSTHYCVFWRNQKQLLGSDIINVAFRGKNTTGDLYLSRETSLTNNFKAETWAAFKINKNAFLVVYGNRFTPKFGATLLKVDPTDGSLTTKKFLDFYPLGEDRKNFLPLGFSCSYNQVETDFGLSCFIDITGLRDYLMLYYLKLGDTAKVEDGDLLVSSIVMVNQPISTKGFELADLEVTRDFFYLKIYNQMPSPSQKQSACARRGPGDLRGSGGLSGSSGTPSGSGGSSGSSQGGSTSPTASFNPLLCQWLIVVYRRQDGYPYSMFTCQDFNSVCDDSFEPDLSASSVTNEYLWYTVNLPPRSYGGPQSTPPNATVLSMTSITKARATVLDPKGVNLSIINLGMVTASGQVVSGVSLLDMQEANQPSGTGNGSAGSGGYEFLLWLIIGVMALALVVVVLVLICVCCRNRKNDKVDKSLQGSFLVNQSTISLKNT